MEKLALLISMVAICLIGYTNTNQPDSDIDSFHVNCDTVNPQIDWHEIAASFPEDFTEVSKHFSDENTIISEGYIFQDLFEQELGVEHKNLLNIQVNFNELTSQSKEVIIDKNLATPCTDCSIAVIDQSPDGEWVLAKIRDNTYDVWLLSEDEAIKVIPDASKISFWTWATDSTALWLSFSKSNVEGTFAIVNDINDEPTVMEFEKLENFPPELEGDPDLNRYYFFTFNPDDKTLWWFQRFSEDVYIYDTLQHTYELKSLRNFVKAEWQNSLGIFMLVYFDGETLLMESQDGEYSIEIPRETVEKLYIPFSEERFLVSNILDYKTSLALDKDSIFVDANGFIYQAQCE